MTVEEIAAERAALTDEIGQLIRAFEERTGALVRGVSLGYTSRTTERGVEVRGSTHICVTVEVP